ncbi:MAG: trpP, partial [Clostridia bacterium]|nr:trpP [Clostridia bacterium]
KFDIMLSFIFVALFISKDFKSVILTAMLGGGITAFTTTFPGGQIPNIIDKLVTCLVIYALLKLLEGFQYKQITAGIIAFIGTLVSGSVFLYSALLLVGLPAPFLVLFMGIVLPTSIANIFVTLIVYNAVKTALKATGVKYI